MWLLPPCARRPVADQRSHAIEFTMTSDGVEISARSAEYGEARRARAPPSPTPASRSNRFQRHLPARLPRRRRRRPISFEFKDDQSAGQMRPLAEEDLKYRYVVMPMRL
jgi:hypothetical protein